MAAEQEVAGRIVMLLASKSVQRIDFQLELVHVTGSSLSSVIGALITRAVGVTDMDSQFRRLGSPPSGINVEIGKVKKGAEAQYDPKNNTFGFPNATFGQTDPREQATIVHESVHAWLDLRMPKVRTTGDWLKKVVLSTTSATNEATAYIAGALYFIYKTTPEGSNPTPSDRWRDHPLFSEAYRIAVGIMNNPGAAVSAADVTALKQKIMDRPIYKKIKDDPTRIFNHDGV